MVKNIRSHRGFVLVVVLVFLIVATIIALSSVRRTLLQERIAGGERERQIAFQSAEMALRDAERDLMGLTFDNRDCDPTDATMPYCRPEIDGRWLNSPNNQTLISAVYRFDNTCANGQCRDAPAPNGNPADTSWIAFANRVPYGTYTGAAAQWSFRRTGGGVLRRPAYAIEYLGPFARGNGIVEPYFRITAWAWDSSADAAADPPPPPVVTLQTVFYPGSF